MVFSNPFEGVLNVPKEGLGLNPILQDPALAIHPPLLYLGFVGSSIYFSAALAALSSSTDIKLFAKAIKFGFLYHGPFCLWELLLDLYGPIMN